MAKIKAEEVAAKLYDINFKLHEIMAQMMSQQQVEEGLSSLPTPLFQAAVDASQEGLELAQEYKPQAPELKGAMGAENLHKLVVKAKETYAVDAQKTVMPAEQAKILAETIMNFLANDYHKIASTMVGSSGEIAGCKEVQSLIPDEGLAVSKYCAGVLPNQSTAKVIKKPLKKKQSFIVNYPQAVEHSLGCHSVTTSTNSEGKTADVAVDYHESGPGYTDSKNRMKGVQKVLENIGFKCLPDYPNLLCNGNIPMEELTKLGFFFSVLRDGDIEATGSHKPDLISEKVWEYVGEMYKKHKESLWDSPKGPLQAGQGKMNWHKTFQVWKEEKELYQKQKVYQDMRQLLVYRDKHHQIEAEYGIDNGHSSQKAVKELLANAKDFISLAKKNGWAVHGLENLIPTFETLAKKASPGNIAGPSDGLGNTMHTIVAGLLQKEGTYANCQLSDISNINVGNLGYCEGVLKGTTATLSHGGNKVAHQVSPNTFQSFILDENPDGSYDVTFFLPGEPELKETLLKLFKSYHFECDQKQCKKNLATPEEVRHLALLLSNLKGLSSNLGKDCLEKSVQEAEKTAKAQADSNKGVMSFTFSPLHETEKEWKQFCKAEGIPLPGVSPEQQAILKLIQNEVYGGCKFQLDEDIVPNKGVMVYCEGIRKNPQAETSGTVYSDSQLNHFYHETTDQIATVQIETLGPGQYHITLSNINMHDSKENLDKAVIGTLQNMGFQCTGTTCQHSVGADQLRLVAEFMSSLHQAYKIEANCVGPAVQYVLQKISTLPKNLQAHQSLVYPWTTEEWNKEVCQKAAKGEKAVPQGETLTPVSDTGTYSGLSAYAHKTWEQLTPAQQGTVKAHLKQLKKQGNPSGLKATKAYFGLGDAIPSSVYSQVMQEIQNETQAVEIPLDEWDGKGVTPKPPFKYKGCTSTTKSKPTQVTQKYCEGVAESLEIGGVGQAFPKKGSYKEGTSAVLQPNNQNLHRVGDVHVLFSSKLKTLYVTLPEVFINIPAIGQALLAEPFYMKKLNNSTYSREVSYSAGAFRIASFFSALANIEQLPAWCQPAAVAWAVQYAKQNSLMNKKPVYPYSPEDWHSQVCTQQPEANQPPKAGPLQAEEPKLSTVGSLEDKLAHPWDYTADKLFEEPFIKQVISTCFAKKVVAASAGQYKDESGHLVLTDSIELVVKSGLSLPQLQNLWQECVNAWQKPAAEAPQTGWSSNIAYSEKVKKLATYLHEIVLPVAEWQTFDALHTSVLNNAAPGATVDTSDMQNALNLLQNEGKAEPNPDKGWKGIYGAPKAKLKFFMVQQQLTQWLLQYFASHPDQEYHLEGLKAAIEYEGIGMPTDEAIESSLSELLKQEAILWHPDDGGEVVYSYKTPATDKNKYFKDEVLKDFILNYAAGYPGKVLENNEIAKVITKQGFTDPGHNHIQHALYLLYKEGKLKHSPLKEEIASYFYPAAIPEQLSPKAIELLEKEAKKYWEQGQAGLITSWIEETFGIPPTQSLPYVKNMVEAFEMLKKAESPADKLDKLIDEDWQKGAKLQNTISKETFEKAKKLDAYKKLPKSIQELMHLYMNQAILKGIKNKTPWDEVVKGLQEKIINEDGYHITPLMVKLQAEIEKKNKIRKGEITGCENQNVCEVAPKYWEEMNADEKADVQNYIEKLSEDEHYVTESFYDLQETLKAIKEKYGLSDSAPLTDMAMTALQDAVEAHQAKKAASSGVEVVDIMSLSAAQRGEVCSYFNGLYQNEKDMKVLLGKICSKFNVLPNNNMVNWITGRIDNFNADPHQYIPLAKQDVVTQKAVAEFAKELVAELPGEKILAIKHLRCLFNLGLKDAKEAIEDAIELAQEPPETDLEDHNLAGIILQITQEKHPQWFSPKDIQQVIAQQTAPPGLVKIAYNMQHLTSQEKLIFDSKWSKYQWNPYYTAPQTEPTPEEQQEAGFKEIIYALLEANDASWYTAQFLYELLQEAGAQAMTQEQVEKALSQLYQEGKSYYNKEQQTYKFKPESLQIDYVKEPWLAPKASFAELQAMGVYDLPHMKLMGQCFANKHNQLQKSHYSELYPFDLDAFLPLSEEQVKQMWGECYQIVVEGQQPPKADSWHKADFQLKLKVAEIALKGKELNKQPSEIVSDIVSQTGVSNFPSLSSIETWWEENHLKKPETDWEKIIVAPWAYIQPSGDEWGFVNVPAQYKPILACFGAKIDEAEGKGVSAAGGVFPVNLALLGKYIATHLQPATLAEMWMECYQEWKQGKQTTVPWEKLTEAEKKQVAKYAKTLQEQGLSEQSIYTKLHKQVSVEAPMPGLSALLDLLKEEPKKVLPNTKDHISKILQDHPETWYTVQQMVQELAASAQIGTTPKYVQDVLETMAEHGDVLWDLTGGSYQWNGEKTEKPPKPEKKSGYAFDNLNDDAKAIINKEINELAKGGMKYDAIAAQIMKSYTVSMSPSLNSLIDKAIAEANASNQPQEADKTILEEGKSYLNFISQNGAVFTGLTKEPEYPSHPYYVNYTFQGEAHFIAYPTLEKAIEYIKGEFKPPKKKLWKELKFIEKLTLADAIHGWENKHKDTATFIEEVAKKYGVQLGLNDLDNADHNYQTALGVAKQGEVWYSWMSDQEKDVLQTDVLDLAKKGKSAKFIQDYLRKEYKLALSFDWVDMVEKTVKKHSAITWTELPAVMKLTLEEFVQQAAEDGDAIGDTIDKVTEKWNVKGDASLKGYVEQVFGQQEAAKDYVPETAYEELTDVQKGELKQWILKFLKDNQAEPDVAFGAADLAYNFQEDTGIETIGASALGGVADELGAANQIHYNLSLNGWVYGPVPGERWKDLSQDEIDTIDAQITGHIHSYPDDTAEDIISYLNQLGHNLEPSDIELQEYIANAIKVISQADAQAKGAPNANYAFFANSFLAKHAGDKYTAQEVYDAFLQEKNDDSLTPGGLLFFGETLNYLAKLGAIAVQSKVGKPNLYWGFPADEEQEEAPTEALDQLSSIKDISDDTMNDLQDAMSQAKEKGETYSSTLASEFAADFNILDNDDWQDWFNEQWGEEETEEVELVSYSDLSETANEAIDAAILKLYESGHTQTEAIQLMAESYHIKPDDPTLFQVSKMLWSSYQTHKLISELFQKQPQEHSDLPTLEAYVAKKLGYKAEITALTLSKMVENKELVVTTLSTKDGPLKVYGYGPYVPSVPFSQLPAAQQNALKKEMVDWAGEGLDYEAISQKIKAAQGWKYLDTEAASFLLETVEYFKKHPAKKSMVEEAAPVIAEMTKVEVSPKFIDKQIVELTKQGWSKEALLEYFKDKLDELTLKQKVKESLKLYTPETKPEASTYQQQGEAFQSWLQHYAWLLLNKGKGIHDVAWQLAHYFNLSKESLMPMVREQSARPLKQVAGLIEMMKAQAIPKTGGCTVDTHEVEGQQVPDLEDLRATAVAFCQGLHSTPDKTYQATLSDGGKTVTFIAPTRAAVAMEEGKEGQFHFLLKTAQAPKAGNWQQLDQEIGLILKELGFNCTYQMNNYTCQLTGQNGSNLSIANQDTLRKAALFLSRLEGIAELEAKCIPSAVQYAKNSAKNANQTSKPWTVAPYPKTKQEWEQMVCTKL